MGRSRDERERHGQDHHSQEREEEQVAGADREIGAGDQPGERRPGAADRDRRRHVGGAGSARDGEVASEAGRAGQREQIAVDVTTSEASPEDHEEAHHHDTTGDPGSSVRRFVEEQAAEYGGDEWARGDDHEHARRVRPIQRGHERHARGSEQRSREQMGACRSPCVGLPSGREDREHHEGPDRGEDPAPAHGRPRVGVRRFG